MYRKSYQSLQDFCVMTNLSGALFDMHATCMTIAGSDAVLPPKAQVWIERYTSLSTKKEYEAIPYREGLCVICPMDPMVHDQGYAVFWGLPYPPSGNIFLVSLFCSMFQSIVHVQQCALNSLLPSPLYYSTRIQKVIQKLEENLEEWIGLDALSQDASLQKNSLCRLFKRETGYSITEYRNRLRVQVSLRLLSDPRLSILEVAYQSGFTDQAYFSRVFRKVMGMNAQAYRNTIPYWQLQ
ncbi:MAG: helix-turn-helix domain-containing protein [Sphaerochaetaceae bacterium]